MTLEGAVINGQIVLDQPEALPEGAKVQVVVVPSAPLPIPHEERLRRLRSIATVAFG
jgi:hypothetical protein